MIYLKKFEEIQYTPSEEREYQDKIDKIVGDISKTIEFNSYQGLKKSEANIKLTANIDDSSKSTLNIRFGDSEIKIFESTTGKKSLWINKPSGHSFTQNTVDAIYDIITRLSDYIDITSSELKRCYNGLKRYKNLPDLINTRFEL